MWSKFLSQPIALCLNTVILVGLASFVTQDNPAKPDETRFKPSGNVLPAFHTVQEAKAKKKHYTQWLTNRREN